MARYKTFPARLEILEARRLLSATYNIVDLGTLGPQYDSSTAESISQNGTVVGYSSQGNQLVRAFEYSHGKMIDLGTLAGESSSAAFGVSDAGFVVGSDGVPGAGTIAVQFSGGKATPLHVLSDQQGAAALDVNGTGQAVGVSGLIDTPFTNNGFFYSGGVLKTIPGSGGGEALAINDHGVAVGNYRIGPSTYGFFIYSNGKTTQVTHGTDSTTAADINQLGQIVGEYTTQSNAVPFIYSNGAFHSLPGVTTGIPAACNDWGQVVGGLFPQTNNDPTLYSGGKLFDLNNLIPANSGWSLTDGQHLDINDAGQIVGTGTFNGQQRAFLLNPITPAASISGTMFSDLNGDGVQESGEPPLVGWGCFIDFNNDGIFDGSDIRAYSNAVGNFSFRGVSPGTYHICQMTPSGWRRTDPTSPLTYTVTVAAGQQVTGKNFGNQQDGSISGNVFNDLNGDGFRESGEEALAGWRVFLDLGTTGTYSSSDPSVLTDTNGNYTFHNLQVKSYIVRTVRPAGWLQTSPVNNDGQHVNVSAGQAVKNASFGERQTLPTSISGVMFNDLNRDGVRESNEPPLVGWTGFLDFNGNGILDPGDVKTTSDASGRFHFDGLSAGTYHISQIIAPNWLRTKPTSPATYTLSIKAGEQRTGIDFGDLLSAVIDGHVFNDLNGDGKQEAGEDGLAGWRVYLDIAGSGIYNSSDPSTLTDSAGYYAFIIPSGTYLLRAIRPAGWKQTAPANNDGRHETVSAGGAAYDVAFGEQKIL